MTNKTPDRREFEMTEAQLERLLKACEPVLYMVFGGMPPSSPQANANRAWRTLGREMGFDGSTAEPVTGKGDRFFTAVPAEESSDG